MSKAELMKEARRLKNAKVEVSGPGIAKKKATYIIASDNAKAQVKAFRALLSKKSAA